MKNDALKQKIKEDVSKIKTDLKNKIKDVDWKEKLRRTRAFFKKAGKKTWEGYKQLPRKAQRAILIGIIALAPTIKVAKVIDKQVEDYKAKKEIQNKQKQITQSLEEKYVLNGNESFQKLYEDGFSLIELSMFPTECLILDPYADNGKKVSNTIGLGSYWYPANGDPKSSEWIKAQQHFKNTGAHSISGETALDLADGWFRYREDGRVYRNMQRWLDGAELNLHEFAAIASVIYNNEAHGKELCKFVKEHYDDPMLCAQKIMSFGANSSFGGIPKRHLHEAYLYLNYDHYASRMYDFFVKTGINSRGEFYAQTSVTQLSKEDVEAGRKAIESENKDQIIAEQNKIISYICKGGRTVREIIYEDVLNPSYREPLLRFCVAEEDGFSLQDVVDGRDASAAEQMYKDALKHYEQGSKLEKEGKKAKAEAEFQKALDGFQGIISGGHDGPDLHNDMAITYYHLGEYQKCIDESAQVLKMGDKDLYPAANYNAGKAYEALGNYARALTNYSSGIKNGGDQKIFTEAITRVRSEQSKIMRNGGRR